MTDVESDEELVELIQRSWERYGVSLVVGVVLALGGVLGWRSYEAHEVETAEAASTAFYRYQQARAEGRDADAALEAARLTEAHGDTAYALFLALGNARDAVDAGDLTAAKAALESGLTLAPTEALKDVVRLRLAPPCSGEAKRAGKGPFAIWRRFARARRWQGWRSSAGMR